MQELQSIIEEAFERRADITPRNVETRVKDAVDSVLEMLDKGQLRVASKIDGQWVTHQWLKKAVLLVAVGRGRVIRTRRVIPVAELQENIRLMLSHFDEYGIIQEIFHTGTKGKGQRYRITRIWKGFKRAFSYKLSKDHYPVKGDIDCSLVYKFYLKARKTN